MEITGKIVIKIKQHGEQSFLENKFVFNSEKSVNLFLNNVKDAANELDHHPEW